jgi:hypothetical protein
MKKALFAVLVASSALAAGTTIKYVSTMTSTAPAAAMSAPLPAGGTYAVQCDTAVYVRPCFNPLSFLSPNPDAGTTPLNVRDGGFVQLSDAGFTCMASSTNGVLVPANGLFDLDLASSSNSVSTVPVSGTGNCKLFQTNFR